MSNPASVPLVDSALAPADFLRRRLLRGLGPLAAPLMNRRELRVALMGAGVVLSALAGTLVFPLWMLALGPIVFGVPHILSDIRYLWVRPGFDRRAAVCVAVGGPLLVGAVTGRLWAGLLAVAGAFVVARTTWPRRIAGLGATALALLAARRFSGAADIVFAHLHNVVAIALWWRWRELSPSARHPRRRSSLRIVPLALVVAASAVVLAVDPVRAFAGTPLLGPRVGYYLATLAPGVDRSLGLRLVLAFCFAQSIHYGIWLRLVPEEDRPRETPRTFAASFRALHADLGAPRLVLFGALALGLAAWACVALAAARAGYLRFAVFHGHLELCAAALLWAERRRPCAAG